MGRDKMSTLYKALPIDTSYQVSVYLAKRYLIRGEEFLKNQPLRNKSTVAAMLVNGSG
jgi:hypothetical protein